MPNAPQRIRCDWDNCPSHVRVNVRGKDFITIIWAKQVRYFHSTDCLALWAASFPIGYVSTGAEIGDSDAIN